MSGLHNLDQFRLCDILLLLLEIVVDFGEQLVEFLDLDGIELGILGLPVELSLELGVPVVGHY